MLLVVWGQRSPAGSASTRTGAVSDSMSSVFLLQAGPVSSRTCRLLSPKRPATYRTRASLALLSTAGAAIFRDFYFHAPLDHAQEFISLRARDSPRRGAAICRDQPGSEPHPSRSCLGTILTVKNNATPPSWKKMFFLDGEPASGGRGNDFGPLPFRLFQVFYLGLGCV